MRCSGLADIDRLTGEVCSSDSFPVELPVSALLSLAQDV